MTRTMSLFGAVLVGAALVLTACKGKEGPSGPAGNSYNPPAQLCAGPTQKGYLGTGSLDSIGAGEIKASAVTITTATTAISLSISMASGPVTGQCRLALFGDTGSSFPNALLAQTDPFTWTPNAVNTRDIPDTYLPVGIYWLATMYSNSQTDTCHYFLGSSVPFASTNFSWGMFPSPFPAGSSSTDTIAVAVNTCP